MDLQGTIFAPYAMDTSTLLVRPIALIGFALKESNLEKKSNWKAYLNGDCIMLVWHHGSALQPCKCPLCRRQITLLVPGEVSLRERNDPNVAEVLGKIERYNHLFGGNTRSLVQFVAPSFFHAEHSQQPVRSLQIVVALLPSYREKVGEEEYYCIVIAMRFLKDAFTYPQRMQDLPFLLRRLLREIMDPQRSLPMVIKARVYIAVKELELDQRKTWFSLVMPFHGGIIPKYIIPSAMVLSAVYVISPVDIIPEGILGIVGLLDDLLVVFICFLHVAAIYRSVLYSRHGGS
ncbi:hypothetical protein SADUNF_Sadunf13G0084900 [Salix dunnii]|uniref:DUF1232 domain-containing protein n=1 Tax=Salix dunnii TaxID=1413687 RepID=A0A835JG59_9ROSI|nr:hypothetical protein SADUNF_Sadunf13G0084900 [Salix dunnii]